MTVCWLVAAPRSGSGKTTVTLGLVVALRRRGLAVRTAKIGPDYIDPAFHAAASGAPGVNLDSWAMPPALLDSLFAQAAAADVLILESAMGLFDGVAGAPGRTGSAADIAARYGVPVLLVLDVSGQSQTAAAVALGMATYDPAVQTGGVILNRAGSAKHRAMVEGAMRLPVLGSIPRDASLGLPERHLGLVQAGEHPALAAQLARLGDVVERCVDLDALLRVAPAPCPPPHAAEGSLPPPGQRIAIASDAAFTFTYPHVVDAWRAAGAELLPFSPLADEPPPAADACWLPGGYPELHAPALTAAHTFRAGLHAFPGPIHGECGGYMVLGHAIETADGVFPMAGLLSHSTSFARRSLHLGYRRATLPGGIVLRGHEFHYAAVTDPGTDAPYALVEDAAGQALGPAGGRRGRVSGSFFHAIAQEPS